MLKRPSINASIPVSFGTVLDFLRNPADLIYGTIRLIEPDTETALPWAREPYACVIFNLHVDHQAGAREKDVGVVADGLAKCRLACDHARARIRGLHLAG